MVKSKKNLSIKTINEFTAEKILFSINVIIDQPVEICKPIRLILSFRPLIQLQTNGYRYLACFIYLTEALEFPKMILKYEQKRRKLW